METIPTPEKRRPGRPSGSASGPRVGESPVRVNVYLPSPLLARVHDNGEGVTNTVRLALGEYLDRREREKIRRKP